MRRPNHKAAHAECPNGVTTWDACDKITDAARPRCVALTEKESECGNFATDDFEGAGYCGVHYGSRVNAALDARRREARKAAMTLIVEESLRSRGEAPHVCDVPLCRFVHRSAVHVCEPACTSWEANSVPVSPQPLTAWDRVQAVPWRATSGRPFTRQSG